MRDLLSRLLRSAALFAVPSIGLQQRGLLAALQTSEERAAFADGRRAIAEQKATDAEHRETLAMLALRDLVRACERCAGLPAAMAAARVLLGEELPPVLAASGLPVAPDDDEPAIGDLPVSP